MFVFKVHSSAPVAVRGCANGIHLSKSEAYPPNLKVQPKHVKEAFRLLNKSIIRVDSPDINFDQEQEDQQDLNGKIPVTVLYLFANNR